MVEAHPLPIRRGPDDRMAPRQDDGSRAGPPGRAAGQGGCGPRRAATRLAAILVAALLAACTGGPRFSVVSDGIERWATVDRPAQPPDTRRPLLVVLHAALFSGTLAREELDLPAIARRAGVALAFPEAAGMVWND